MEVEWRNLLRLLRVESSEPTLEGSEGEKEGKLADTWWSLTSRRCGWGGFRKDWWEEEDSN